MPHKKTPVLLPARRFFMPFPIALSIALKTRPENCHRVTAVVKPLLVNRLVVNPSLNYCQRSFLAAQHPLLHQHEQAAV